MKVIRIVVFALVVFHFSGCAPFKPLSVQIADSTEIFGTYRNACDSTDFWYKADLWNNVDEKYRNEAEGLTVKIDRNAEGMLRFQLMSNDSAISETIVKGKFKDDNCYYSRRKFYIIPFIPLYFGFSNTQERFYRLGDTLVIDKTFNRMGAVILFASGDAGNYYWLYDRNNLESYLNN